jgi:hypothetical protein
VEGVEGVEVASHSDEPLNGRRRLDGAPGDPVGRDPDSRPEQERVERGGLEVLLARVRRHEARVEEKARDEN